MRKLPVIMTGLAALLFCMALAYFEPEFLHPLARYSSDAVLRSMAQPPRSNLVAVVDIDDASLAQFGQWPWSRTLMKQMHDKLLRLGVSVIAYDIIFAEPDRTSPKNATREWTREFTGDIRVSGIPPGRDDFDADFAESMARGPTLLSCFMELADTPVSDPGTDAFYEGHYFETGPANHRLLPQAKEVIASLPIFQKAAASIAFFNATVDPDNIVRRTPLLFAFGPNRVYPALSIEALRLHRRIDNIHIEYDESIHGIADIRLKDLKIPTDEYGRLVLNFRSQPFPRVSAADILNGRVSSAALSNRIVLIGTSAAGLKDLQATPLKPEVPGVEIHATAIDNMAAGDMLREPQWLKWANLFAMAFLCGLIIPIIHRARSWIAFGVTIMAISLLVLLSEQLLIRHRIVASPFEAGLSIALVYTLMTVVKYWNEERARRRIRSMFGAMVSSEVLHFIEEHPENFSLAGRKTEATVFVSDIVNFSSMAEKLSPDALSRLMNSYLTPMANRIMQRGGFVDKFDGDAVMAVWGVPYPMKDHAAQACLAALDQIQFLETLRSDLAQQFQHEIHIRIGINTGLVTAGNMGSEKRFQYTVLGDSVNQAFRNEDICRFYKVPVIIGENTYLQACDAIEVRRLGLVVLKGKSQPVTVYQLLSRKGELSESMRQLVYAYEEACRLFEEQDWARAQQHLTEALKIFPHDGPSQLLLQRIQTRSDQTVALSGLT
jgi:adenylate cyclase